MHKLNVAAALLVGGLSVPLRAADFTPFFPTIAAPARDPSPPALSDRPSAVPFALTLYWENDGGFAKPIDRHDRHYTAGYAMSLAARPEFARTFFGHLPSFFNEFDRENPRNAFAVGAIAGGQIYTPENYTLATADLTDRPYAGYLRAGFYFQRAADYSANSPLALGDFRLVGSFEHMQIDLGLIGPSSLGENAQTMIHDAFNYDRPRGWNFQLNDEPTVDFTYARKWKFAALSADPWRPHFEFIPEAAVTAGTVHRELVGGATFRLAWGELPADFGPGRIDFPAAFTGDLASHSLSLFVRPAVHLVEHNTLIEGNNFRSSPVTQDIEPVFAELQYGVACQFLRHFELAYFWTCRSPEFEGQHGWDSTGTITFSATWGF